MKPVSVLVFVLLSTGLLAQDAAQSNVDLGAKPEATAAPEKSPPPDVPELSQLDQVFKQTSLGKAADEYRTRIEWRKLQNEAVNDPAVIAAKKAAESAPTDLEKRERLREYYEVYYGRMRARASSAEMKSALDSFKAEHVKLLDQPRVRPSGDGAIPASTPQKKKHRKSMFGT
jgi:hypothetical protein